LRISEIANKNQNVYDSILNGGVNGVIQNGSFSGTLIILIIRSLRNF